ncbi:MAG: B-box zinc finger protein, partial [Chloroflexota bacterium]
DSGPSPPHDHSQFEVVEETEVLFCANHPTRQTHLRCNKCGKPICSSCAQPTPVGYRCPQCIREHQDIYYTAKAIDYLLVILVTVPLSLLGGWLAMRLGFFTIFLGAGAGTLIGRIAFRVARRRRGRGMPELVAALVVIGGVLPALPLLIFGGFNFGLIWSGVYIFTATGAAYYQMR